MSTDYRDRWNDRGLAILLALSAAVLVIHLLTGWRYGFHRDELATLDDARHIAWGPRREPHENPMNKTGLLQAWQIVGAQNIKPTRQTMENQKNGHQREEKGKNPKNSAGAGN